MSYLTADSEQIAELLALKADGPLRMLNLLRFRERTEDGSMSGASLYDRYLRRMAPILGAAGGKLIFSGRALQTLIGPGEERWDRVLIVEYPSRERFLEMSRSEAFREVSADRKAALEDSRLVVMTE